MQTNPENTSENNVQNIDELKKALDEEKSRAEANLAGWQRSQADFMNYKRFAEQDKAETVKYANVVLLQKILPVVDDLKRAMAAIPPEDDKKSWVEGIRLIERKLQDTLEKVGVTPIKSEGEEFDCRYMEAITCAPGKKDVVVQELETGYRLQDKVIRPAKVIVGSGEEQANKEEK